jgi:ATP-binding cassette subfamily B protein
MSVIGPLREIHRILDEAHESTIRVKDLQNLKNQPVDESFKTKLKIEESKTLLELKKLNFSYASKGPTLSNINVSIKKGEKIGVAGASGCGKSTLVKILLRILHRYSGQVTLLGKNLKDLTRQEIAEKIAYIPQKTYIFSGTIKDNIVYGVSRKFGDKEIIKAAQQANIYNEIKTKLGGFNGRVTENGNNLSGGQKQRIALARLVLQNPELLIFDEATSALDNTNEKIIQTNLEKLFSDKTMIIIAHGLTTLKNTNRILVFDKGRIVQEGKYSILANKKGKFREFLLQHKE